MVKKPEKNIEKMEIITNRKNGDNHKIKITTSRRSRRDRTD
jgi:hypothetical protein